MPTLGANYNVTVLEDGYCASSAVSDVEFRGLWAAFGRPEMADDPRFSTAVARSQNTPELVRMMKELSSKTKLDDFLRRRSKISLVVRHDVLAKAPGLREACRILFGDAADAQLEEYFGA